MESFSRGELPNGEFIPAKSFPVENFSCEEKIIQTIPIPLKISVDNSPETFLHVKFSRQTENKTNKNNFVYESWLIPSCKISPGKFTTENFPLQGKFSLWDSSRRASPAPEICLHIFQQ